MTDQADQAEQRPEDGDGTEPGHGASGQPWDDDALEVVRTVGKLVRIWRERAGLTQADLGARIGYGAEQVSSVERARRIPKPEFLSRADEVLGACGTLTALVEDVTRAHYPRKVRTWPGWRRRRSSWGPMPPRSYTVCCRPRTTLAPCSACTGRRWTTTRWSAG